MRYKSVLGAFTFFVFASSIAMIFFIQSESFGKVLSKVVSDIGYRKTQTRIKFESVNITLFPPGIHLQNVYLKKKLDPEFTIIAEFGEIGFIIPLLRLE